MALVASRIVRSQASGARATARPSNGQACATTRGNSGNLWHAEATKLRERQQIPAKLDVVSRRQGPSFEFDYDNGFDNAGICQRSSCERCPQGCEPPFLPQGKSNVMGRETLFGSRSVPQPERTLSTRIACARASIVDV